MPVKYLHTSIFTLFASLLILAACSPGSNEVNIDVDANKSRVVIQAGEVLVVSLESTPSSGYGWEITEIDERVIQQVGEVEFIERPGIPQVGDWDVEVFRFEPVVSGECTLTLVYRSPQEPGPPLDTFTITVVVP